jgi:tetratricopeptide (TPR) repeat protein
MRRTAIVTSLAFGLAIFTPYLARADVPPPAEPPPSQVADEALQQAKMHFEAGKAAFNAQDYPTAIREFKAAEALRPSPLLSYNIGLANEKLGKKRVAVKYYRRYLEQLPNAPNRPDVERSIAALDRQIAAEPPPAGAPGQPPPAPPPPPPKKRSLWWVWLIVAGGVTIIVGVTVWAVLATDATRTTSTSTFLTSTPPALNLRTPVEAHPTMPGFVLHF